MDEHLQKIYKRLNDFYATGSVPWDESLPPPEVMSTLEGLPVGRALDLGCGYGRASIYMAQLGWVVDGVDFVPHAAAVAAERAREAGLDIRFHIASVTDLDFLAGPYDFVLDVGCVHALDEMGFGRYCHHVKRLLRSGGKYLLFAHLWDESSQSNDDRPGGIPEGRLREAFLDGFELDQFERGVTRVRDMEPWQSGWFYYRRL